MDAFSFIILGVAVFIIALISLFIYWIWRKLYYLTDEEKAFFEWENELNPSQNEDHWI